MRKNIIILCILLIVTLIMVGCSNGSNVQPETNPIIDTTPTENPIEIPTEPYEPTETPIECVTETNWDAPFHYLCAVAIEGYDGVNLEPGTYHFYIDYMDGTGSLSGQTNTTWEIYITKDVVYDIGALTPEDASFVGRVGGETNEEQTLALKKDYYVYLKCCDIDKEYLTDKLQIIQIGK